MSQNNQSNQNSFLENALQRNKNAKLEKKGIGQVVKSAISGEMNTIIFIALCMLLIVLIIVLYYYTFKAASNTSLADVDYKKDLKLQKLPTCNEIDEKFRYYLCDYYIASSFNTVSLGNLHFGYVNKDMVKQTLLSGARYIQIPICSANINNYAEPVVATAERGKSLITSLNTIDLKEVLAIIKSYAFKYIDNSENIDNISKKNLQDTNDVYRNINYPLIIHLQINTYNIAVLNKAYLYIVEMIGPLLVDSSKYYTKPIGIEKLCRLLNKIILFATPGYEQSELRKIVVPNIVLFNRLNQSSLAEKRVTEEDAEDHYSNLSFNKAVNTYKNVDNLGNIIGKILEEASGNLNNSSNNLENDYENYDHTTVDTYEDNNSELDVEGKKLYDLQDNKININNSGSVDINNSSNSILNNKKLMDRIVIYNMIGLTLVEPTDSHETYTKNYNPYSAFKNGCQLISMNYQQNDEFMADYIKVFQKSSFVLKPSGLRLPIYETEIFNTLDDFKLNVQNDDNIMYDFINLYNNKYIVLSEILTDESKVITSKFTNLYFKLNEYTFRQGNESYKDILDKKSLFKVLKSPLSENNNLVILVSADDESKAITVNSNFNNEPNLPTNASPVLLGNYDSSDLINIKRQSFYPEIGLHNGSDNTISFRFYSEPKNLGINKVDNNEVDSNKVDNNDINNINNKSIFSQYLAIANNKLLTLPIQNNKRNLTFNYKKINIRSNIYFKNNLSEQYIQVRRMIVMVSQFESKATKFTLVKSSENNNSFNIQLVKFKLRINNVDRFLIASGRNIRITKDTNENRSNYTKFLLHYDDEYDLYKIESSNGRLLVIDNNELKLIPKDKLSKFKMNEKEYFEIKFDNSII